MNDGDDDVHDDHDGDHGTRNSAGLSGPPVVPIVVARREGQTQGERLQDHGVKGEYMREE